MSADDLPELPDLPDDARAALAGARTLVDPGDAVRVRMRARLAQALPPPSGGGGENGGGEGKPAGAAPFGGLPRVPLWAVAAAFAVGGAAGLLYPRAPVERVVMVQASSSPSPLPRLAAAADATASGALPALPALPTIDMKDLPSLPSATASTGSARSGSDLAAERAQLDVARTALGRGDGENALAACDAHAGKFPRGALAEEREAIAVQALVLEHRSDDARARAQRFRKAYPRSILLPAVLAAAGVEPSEP